MGGASFHRSTLDGGSSTPPVAIVVTFAPPLPLPFLPPPFLPPPFCGMALALDDLSQ